MALKDIQSQTAKSVQGLRYPYDAIHDTTDYLLINVVGYRPAGGVEKRVTREVPDSYTTPDPNDPSKEITVQTTKVETLISKSVLRSNRLFNTNSIKNNFGSIILPIPSNIQDGNSVSFAEGSLDGLTASVLDYVSSTVAEGATVDFNNISEFIQRALRNGANIGLSKDAADYFNRTIAAAAANIPFGGNLTASQLLARQTGQILNPNMELLFNGVTLRSFRFSFKFTPRNSIEAGVVKNIIRKFKQNMSPQSNGLYLKTPNIFELTYMKGRDPHPFLHKFKQCALTDMSVNYTGEGIYATYGGANNNGGGTPISMIMDLGFKELEPIYNSDYKDSDEKGYISEIHGGVGF